MRVMLTRAVQSSDDSNPVSYSFIFATLPFAVPQQEDLDTIFGTPQSRFVLSIVANSAPGGQRELKRWKTVCHTSNEQNRTISCCAFEGDANARDMTKRLGPAR